MYIQRHGTSFTKTENCFDVILNQPVKQRRHFNLLIFMAVTLFYLNFVLSFRQGWTGIDIQKIVVFFLMGN